MKFYVASKFENYRQVRALCDELKSRGHLISCDWTRNSQFDETGTLIEECKLENLTPLEQLRAAFDDFDGAAHCDALVLLPRPDMTGALIEVGIALAYSRIVHVIGEVRRTVFWSLPNVRHWESFETFLANILPVDNLVGKR